MKDYTILFTGAIRGGRAKLPEYTIITRELEKYGKVLSSHIADHTLSEYGETQYTDKEIYNREMRALQDADIVVAEISTPSMGVGYILAKAHCYDKKIIALCDNNSVMHISSMIAGDQNVTIATYDSEKDIKNALSSHIGKYTNQ